MEVSIVSITPDAEPLIARLARISSADPDKSEYSQLIKYLIQHAHWSPFEMAHIIMRIVTSRAVAQQILRHRSFSFQEFSQRYSSRIDFPELMTARKQGRINRQSSIEMVEEPAETEWDKLQFDVYSTCYTAYERALQLGVCREQARFLLPLAAPTTLYMAGSVRSWIHYLQLRTRPDTQSEHRDVAEMCCEHFISCLPETSRALGWTEQLS